MELNQSALEYALKYSATLYFQTEGVTAENNGVFSIRYPWNNGVFEKDSLIFSCLNIKVLMEQQIIKIL